MRSRALGPSAPFVSAVGFGGMHLSVQGRPPEEQGVQVLHAALDSGVTFIDTANTYCLDQHDLGHNERLVARALKSWGGPRDTVLVGTKGGLTRPGGRWESDARPARLREACEQSLRALEVEQIDLYQLHAPDPKVRFTDSVAALADLRREGKIRWVGLSNVSVSEIEAAEEIVPIVTVQNRLNPFFRESLEDGVVDSCALRGIGFLAYSPVGGGRLNKKLPEHPVVQAVARRHGASPHAVTLAWVLAQSPTVIVIPSARRVEHVEDCATAANIVLSPDDIRAIDKAEFSRA